MRYQHVLAAIYGRPWAILPTMLDLIVEIAEFRASGGSLSDDEIRARVAAANNGPRAGAKTARSNGNAVSVIPIYGVLSQRAGLMSNSSGGTSVEGVTRAFRESLADGDIGSIVFDVDSPGGSVDGIEELAAEIRAARGQKPIAAVANTQMASAAYWLGSAADELVVTPSGAVGSIGVIAAHVDDTKAREAAGISRTIIATPPGKADGFDGDAISAEGLDEIQGAVDAYYAMFTAAVAKGRGVGIETVRKDYGAGRMLLAKPALAAGMVDRIDTLDATIARAARGRIGSKEPDALPAGAIASIAAQSGTDLSLVAAAYAALDNAEDLAVALDSGLPFASHLSLVSDQVDALVRHASEHMTMRARSGRTASAASVEQIERIRASYAELERLLSAEPGRSREAGTTSDRARAIAAQARIRIGRLAATSLD